MKKTFERLTQIMEQYDEVLLSGHKNIDLDALGAVLGMYHIVQTKGKKVSIYLEDTITNTSVVKALEKLKLYHVQVSFIHQDEVKEKDPEKTLYILIDTHNAKLLDQPWMFTYFKHQMVLDHHIKMVDALIGSEYTYINSRLSSMVEFVSLYLQYVDEKVAPIVGTIMLAGMEIDTNSYNIKTTAQTYEVAAYLMRMGANNIDKQNLLQESMEVYKRRQDFIKTSYMINENMALCTLNDEIFEKGDLAQIAEELLQFDHVEAAFAIGKIGPTEIGISARSVGTINVQKMMVQLGGGGHKSDAAAQIPHATINQIKEKLLEIVN